MDPSPSSRFLLFWEAVASDVRFAGGVVVSDVELLGDMRLFSLVDRLSLPFNGFWDEPWSKVLFKF